MFIRRDFELRVQTFPRKNGTNERMEERRLSIYLGNRNALEILKLRGLYRTSVPPFPHPPPISRCIQFYEGNRFALGFACSQEDPPCTFTVDASLTKFPCHVAHTNGRRDFPSILTVIKFEGNVIYTCLSFLFRFIPFYSLSSLLSKETRRGG